MSKKLTVVTYDIETGLSKFVGFRPGEQHVNHKQLLKGYLVTPIICLSYAINNAAPKTLVYDLSTASSKKMIEEFDKIIESADIVIGKNNTRFDDKHLNYHRMLNKLDGMPEWLGRTEDLESQMRRFFFMPSYTLDHLSEVMGLGGKTKMDFSDWVDILMLQTVCQFNHKMKQLGSWHSQAVHAYCLQEYNLDEVEVYRRGQKALDKMIKYNKKDVRDTRALWNYCIKHFKPKFNQSVHEQRLVCKQPGCGSSNIHKNGTRQQGQTVYQNYRCKAHGGYAGRHPVNSKNPRVLH